MARGREPKIRDANVEAADCHVMHACGVAACGLGFRV